MKVAAVRSLPFHAWVLADTVAALRALGVEVEEFDHVPQHSHDWAQNNGALLASLGVARPDALLMADYPYGPFREAAGGCPVFATRHSLAARGNTWAKEQREADYLACFGEWDDRLRFTHNVSAKRGVLQVGCPWASPLLAAGNCGACWRCDPTYRGMGLCQKCGNKRCPHAWNCHRACTGSNEPGQPGSGYGRPIVAWCPTWNDWAPDVAEEITSLRDEGAHVVYRPHYATAWRNPAALDRARTLGFEIDDPLKHPADLLLQADVLVGDVSGIVLLALAVPGAALPIVQVDPPEGTTGSQIEKWGPEWTLRAHIGPVITPPWVARSVRSVLDLDDRYAQHRREARRHLFGVDPLPGGLTPGQRLANEIVARVG